MRKFNFSKMSELYQDVMLAMEAEDYYQTLEQEVDCSRGKLGWHAKKLVLKNLRTQVDTMISRLGMAEQRYICDCYTDNQKGQADWFSRHMDQYPEDAEMLCSLRLRTSPWLRAYAEGFSDWLDRQMTKLYPTEWQSAKSRRDIKTLDRLLLKENPQQWRKILSAPFRKSE